MKTMKVKELVEQLSKFSPELDIVLQADDEGNGYRYANSADNDGIIVDPGEYHLEVQFDTWSADDACMEQDEWNDMLARPRCVVIS